ncbi:hypothetical protein GCM10009609_34430 [Pseudonocardia aurantiaca]|uniref:Uncharacterized protein n=1 Tax=Pseudonocardia aurantiaca TaxID=75290 RepID=A0ABW4FMV3_9PSEU
MTEQTESELAQALAETDDSHDVTAKDQLWLLLAAIVPFAAATLWYIQR